MGAIGVKSKKQSDVNFPSKRPDSPVFFLDRSLGNQTVADALRQKEASVEIHDDHFSQDAKDEVWLKSVGEKGWIVITKDKKIRYRKNESLAVKKANARLFVLVSGELRSDEMADIFIKALPKIKRFISKHRPPFIAKITKGGAVSMLVDY